MRVAQFFSPGAFTAPIYGTVGNLGRDTLTGPGYANWDLSLLKATQLTERTRLQFRAEFFNVLNHTNLQTPNAVVFTSGPYAGHHRQPDRSCGSEPNRRRHHDSLHQSSDPTRS